LIHRGAYMQWVGRKVASNKRYADFE